MTDGIVRVKLELASNGTWRRWELPSGCLCPITQEPYEDPVTDPVTDPVAAIPLDAEGGEIDS